MKGRMMPSTNSKPPDPKRGEIWIVEMDPARGSELRKTRPVVVLSSDTIRSLAVRVVVPITGWQEPFRLSPWKIKVESDSRNGLDKLSAADALQVRCVSTDRFLSRRGTLPPSVVDEIVDGVHYCIE